MSIFAALQPLKTTTGAEFLQVFLLAVFLKSLECLLCFKCLFYQKETAVSALFPAQFFPLRAIVFEAEASLTFYIPKSSRCGVGVKISTKV